MAALVREVRALGERELDALAVDRAGRIPPSTFAALRELGLFGVTLPESHGGAGLGLPEASAVVAALAGYDRSVAVSVGLHLGLGTRGLVAFGGAGLKDRLLPALASGERIAAFATTEPGAGSDLSVLQTVLTEEGGKRLVTGQKAYVTNGGFAGTVTVATQSPGLGAALRGTTLVVLEPSQPGFTVGAEEKKLGLKGSSTTPLYFDRVEVAPDAVLGEPGGGAAQLAHILCWGRLLMSAGCVGTAKKALALALAHTAERRQFGKPLVAQEVVQQRLGAMATTLYAMQALVEDAAHSPDEASLVRLSTSAKLFCSEGAGQVCDLALQLHGGAGFIEESGLPLLVRDARVTRIFEGANDVLWTHRGLLDVAGGAEALGQGGGRAGEAAVSLRRVLLDEHGVRVLGRKAVLHRIGQALMWKDAAAAALTRARTPVERGLAQAFEAQATSQVAQVGRPLEQPHQESDWQAALNREWES